MNNILPGDIICLKASWASKLPYWSFWAIVYRGLIAGQKLFIKNPKYLHVGTVVNMPPTLLTTGNLVPVIEEEYNGPIKDLKALNSSFFNEFDVYRVKWRSTKDRKRFVEHVENFVGKGYRYGYEKLVTTFLDRVLKQHLAKSNMSFSVDCSIMPAEILVSMGYFLWPDLNTMDITPSDYPGKDMVKVN